MKPAYYNEIDPAAAALLRGLIAAGLIAPGEVDERSITDVKPDDLRGFGQCHFFAGIGGWSLALRLAGVPDDRPIWTGSCPCQPFSTAGKQRGSEDERHLWPAFYNLIRERRPRAVAGEQVAGSAGLAWWDHVAADLESSDYAVAAANLGAHSVGAPHIRQRLYWVAHATGVGRWREARQFGGIWPAERREASELADAGSARTGRDAGTAPGPQARGGGAWRSDGIVGGDSPVACGADDRLADAAGSRRGQWSQRDAGKNGRAAPESGRLCDPIQLADADQRGPQARGGNERGTGSARGQDGHDADRRRELGHADGMHAEQSARQGPRPDEAQGAGPCGQSARSGDDGVSLVNAQRAGLEGHRPDQAEGGWHRATGSAAAPGAPDWRNLEWIPCTDGKARPTESTVQWLDDGLSGELGYRRHGDRLVLSPLVEKSKNRIARLRGYGNAIVPAVASEFLMAFFDVMETDR